MLIQHGNREEAVHALIEMWIKDPNQYCVTCGEVYIPGESCCDKRIIGNNADTLKRFAMEMREIRETRKNKHASNKDKTMRWGVSVPVGLYNFLDKSMQRLYKERLFTKEHGVEWFNRKFGKYFAVPEET